MNEHEDPEHYDDNHDLEGGAGKLPWIVIGAGALVVIGVIIFIIKALGL